MRALLAIGAAAIAVTIPVQTSAASVSKTANFAGYWASSCWGNLSLSQKGTKVTGTFSWHNGKVVGTVRGSKLIGRWRIPSQDDSGRVVVTMSTSGKRFSGHWTYDQKSKVIRASRHR